MIYNRIRRPEILEKQVDYIINNSQYITTRPQFEIIEKIDIISLILSMFKSEKHFTNLYSSKEMKKSERKDGVYKDAKIEVFEPNLSSSTEGLVIRPKKSSLTSMPVMTPTIAAPTIAEPTIASPTMQPTIAQLTDKSALKKDTLVRKSSSPQEKSQPKDLEKRLQSRIPKVVRKVFYNS